MLCVFLANKINFLLYVYSEICFEQYWVMSGIVH